MRSTAVTKCAAVAKVGLPCPAVTHRRFALTLGSEKRSLERPDQRVLTFLHQAGNDDLSGCVG